MELQRINEILQRMAYPHAALSAEPFRAEEDGAAYSVWKLKTANGPVVLKKVSPEEQAVYEAFFPGGGGAVPAVHAFHDCYMLMEHIPGQTLSRCTRQKLICALDALIAMQARHWENTALTDVGYGFSKSYPNREKRLPYMEDLGACYEAYLEAFRTLPRTLCNDDMLPFNVLVSGDRAVILDWEFGGILPYPCALARLLAYGEEAEDAMFYMTREDQIFAVDYYYENLIDAKGIPYEEYLHTMRLFFFKEYSEWIYCANSSGDRSGEYYIKYSQMARKLAAQLGF